MQVCMRPCVYGVCAIQEWGGGGGANFLLHEIITDFHNDGKIATYCCTCPAYKIFYILHSI